MPASQQPIGKQIALNVKQTQIKEICKSDELLGELLAFLRQNKVMSTLMVCRQIEEIAITNGVAELISNKFDISELVNVERHKIELDKFFGQRGLGFKIKEKINNKTSADLLREYFGDKLIIE